MSGRSAPPNSAEIIARAEELGHKYGEVATTRPASATTETFVQPLPSATGVYSGSDAVSNRVSGSPRVSAWRKWLGFSLTVLGSALQSASTAYGSHSLSDPGNGVSLWSPKIMLFGGQGHQTYLKCLNGDRSAYDSIFNEYGPNGNCRGLFSDNLYCRGLFKQFGTTGLFQNFSACAPNANDPPVIVDQSGNYYGRFSVGGMFGHTDAVCTHIGRYKNDDTCSVVKYVCGK